MILLKIFPYIILLKVFAAIVPYIGEKSLGRDECLSNGSVFVDTCIRMHETKRNLNDSIKACILEGGRLLNLPNGTYNESLLPLNTSSMYWLGMGRKGATTQLSDFYWIAGNSTYSVVHNNFIQTSSLGLTFTCFNMIYSNNEWKWSGYPSAACVSANSKSYICQYPLKDVAQGTSSAAPTTSQTDLATTQKETTESISKHIVTLQQLIQTTNKQTTTISSSILQTTSIQKSLAQSTFPIIEPTSTQSATGSSSVLQTTSTLVQSTTQIIEATSTQLPSACQQNGGVTIGQTCYVVPSFVLPYCRAMKYCNELGGKLVALDSLKKTDMIMTNLSSVPTVTGTWIGLYGNGFPFATTSFYWMTAIDDPTPTPNTFDNWQQSFPTTISTTDKCVFINKESATISCVSPSSWCWQNADCTFEKSFICEIETFTTTAVPTYTFRQQNVDQCAKVIGGIAMTETGCLVYETEPNGTWFEMMTYCNKKGGYLSRLVNNNTLPYITTKIKNLYPSSLAWIGLLKTNEFNDQWMVSPTLMNYPENNTNMIYGCGVFNDGIGTSLDCNLQLPALCMYPDGIDICASTPCYNGSTCIASNGQYTCICATGYTGFTCEEPFNTLPALETSGLSASCNGVMFNGFCYMLTSPMVALQASQMCTSMGGIPASIVSSLLMAQLKSAYGSAMPASISLAANVSYDDCGNPHLICPTTGMQLPSIPNVNFITSGSGCARAMQSVMQSAAIDILVTSCSTELMALCQIAKPSALPSVTTTNPKPEVSSEATMKATQTIVPGKPRYVGYTEYHDGHWNQTCFVVQHGQCKLWEVLGFERPYILEWRNATYTNWCPKCIINNTITCGFSTKYICKCRKNYSGIGCELAPIVPEGMCKFGVPFYNDVTERFKCDCQDGFQGTFCDHINGTMPVGGPVSRIVQRVQHDFGCFSVITMLTVTSVVQLRFDWTTPFGILKAISNFIMVLTHTLIYFFQDPNVFNISRKQCNFVTLNITFLHTVYAMIFTTIAMIANAYITGSVRASQTFPMCRFLMLALLLPFFSYLIIAYFFFNKLTQPWYCLVNMEIDVWSMTGNIPFILLTMPFLLFHFGLIATEAAGIDSWYGLGSRFVVNKLQMHVALLTRTGFTIAMCYPFTSFFGIFLSSLALYTFYPWLFPFATICNIFFGCSVLIFEMRGLYYPYMMSTKFFKWIFRFIPCIRKWKPKRKHAHQGTVVLREKVSKWVWKKLIRRFPFITTLTQNKIDEMFAQREAIMTKIAKEIRTKEKEKQKRFKAKAKQAKKECRKSKVEINVGNDAFDDSMPSTSNAGFSAGYKKGNKEKEVDWDAKSLQRKRMLKTDGK